VPFFYQLREFHPNVRKTYKGMFMGSGSLFIRKW
jgi:hypothetical protein